MNTVRVGVFATLSGWRTVGAGESEDHASHDRALQAAFRLAHLARWRGAQVQVLVQDHPGGPLSEATRLEIPPAEARRPAGRA
jgi:hypothetical protein